MFSWFAFIYWKALIAPKFPMILKRSWWITPHCVSSKDRTNLYAQKTRWFFVVLFAKPLPKCVALLTIASKIKSCKTWRNEHSCSGTTLFPIFLLTIILTTVYVTMNPIFNTYECTMKYQWNVLQMSNIIIVPWCVVKAKETIFPSLDSSYTRWR